MSVAGDAFEILGRFVLCERARAEKSAVILFIWVHICVFFSSLENGRRRGKVDIQQGAGIIALMIVEGRLNCLNCMALVMWNVHLT